jgi:hypothetical protein
MYVPAALLDKCSSPCLQALQPPSGGLAPSSGTGMEKTSLGVGCMACKGIRVGCVGCVGCLPSLMCVVWPAAPLPLRLCPFVPPVPTTAGVIGNARLARTSCVESRIHIDRNSRTAEGIDPLLSQPPNAVRKSVRQRLASMTYSTIIKNA